MKRKLIGFAAAVTMLGSAVSGFAADQVDVVSGEEVLPIAIAQEYDYLSSIDTVAVGGGIKWIADDLTAGEYTEPLVADGLYIGANDSTDESGKNNGSVTVDGSNTTIGSTKYTQRIKTGGKGDPETGVRCFCFKVDSDCELSLDATSSSSGAVRDVIVLHGESESHLDISDKATYKLDGMINAGETVVIYSAEGGLNIYGISIAPPAVETPAPAEKEQLPADTLITFDNSIGSYLDGDIIEAYVGIYGTSAIVVDTSNKTINGTKYATRLKLGGNGTFNTDGTPKNRVIGVIPAAAGTLTVDFANASSAGDARSLIVKQGSEAKAEAVEASASGTLSMTVAAGEEVYLYSENGAVNVYGIKLEIEAEPTDPPAEQISLPDNTIVTFDDGIGTVYTDTDVFGDYVKIYTNGSEMTIDESNKTIGGTSYTSRIKLGGIGSFNSDGSPKSRVISVIPSVSGTLTVDFAHASSTGDARSLVAAQSGITTTETIDAGEAGTLTIDVAADEEVYLYAEIGAVNIYSIALNYASDLCIADLTADMSIAGTDKIGFVTLNVKNPFEPATASVLMNVYDSNGKLVKCQFVDTELSTGSNDIAFSDIQIENALGKSYHIKCFVWDSMDSMTILTDAASCDI